MGGLSLAGVAAVALTFSGPKAPPDYRSPVDVAPAAADVPAPGTTGGADPSQTPSAGGSAAATTAPDGAAPDDAAPDDAEPATGGTVAVVLGDGLSATPAKDSAFACAAVVRRGWECRSFAAAGSGYLSRGDDGTYLDQLAKAGSLDDVGLVVVSGGGVDRTASADAARGAAERLVARAVYTFPAATIVLVPPFDTGGGSGPGGTAIRDVLRGEADGREVRFADPAGWFRDLPAVLADDGRSLTAKAASAAAQRLSAVVPAVADAG
ncbi:hypothetical protein [Kineosporia sp. A_224]|uniref:hypothetical protein n=1 Tax=Kineosporia sp. A_224 TaxID=1962180 RepID=UPI001179FC43|nr:hypothetical protein [Kineosporia sp. A_224]